MKNFTNYELECLTIRAHRAFRRYCKTGGTPKIEQIDFKEKQYLVLWWVEILNNCIVYRITNQGQLRRLKKVPKGLSIF